MTQSHHVTHQWPDSQFVRLSSILAPTGPLPISRSSWWAGVASGRYPKPVKLGPRITAWRVPANQRPQSANYGSRPKGSDNERLWNVADNGYSSPQSCAVRIEQRLPQPACRTVLADDFNGKAFLFVGEF
jgi:prophage regulatory protein